MNRIHKEIATLESQLKDAQRHAKEAEESGTLAEIGLHHAKAYGLRSKVKAMREHQRQEAELMQAHLERRASVDQERRAIEEHMVRRYAFEARTTRTRHIDTRG